MSRHFLIDDLNNSSKETIFIRKNELLLKKLAKETHFNLKEVKALALIHYKICRERGFISRTLFRDIFHAALDYTENMRHILIDKMFSAIVQYRSVYVDINQWIRGFSIILKGTLEEKTDFVFTVYDLLMTGNIYREQMFSNMRGCLIYLGPDEDVNETLKEFINVILRTLDIDRNGCISEENFKSAIINKNKSLLECMGPVLPSRYHQYAFLTTFTNKIGDLESELLSL